MGFRLLKSLTKHYKLVVKATRDRAIDVPSELDFVPGPGDDLESMIWVLTYAIMLHHQASLQGPAKADYKHSVVDNFYGSLSYAGLAEKRNTMVSYGTDPFDDDPEDWIPDPVQCKWFRGAMTLVAGQTAKSSSIGFKPITFGAFDALCDEFINISNE